MSQQEFNISRYDGDFDAVQCGLAALKPFEFVNEPTVICDLSNIVTRVRLWQDKMPRVTLSYPIRDNNDPVVLRMLERMGVKFSCSSKDEIRSMRLKGVNSSDLFFANPVKIISHLRYAQKQHVGLLAVDCLDELEKVKMYHPEAKILLKINWGTKSDETFPFRGCDPKTDALKLMMEAKNLELNLAGISFDNDTDLFEPELYKSMLITARSLFDYGKGILGLDLNIISIGGGVPATIDEDGFRFFSAVINKTISELFPEPSIRIMAEPGDFLVAPSMTLFCTVQARKEINSKEHGQLMGYYINYSEGLRGALKPMCIETESEEENIRFPSAILGVSLNRNDAIIHPTDLPIQYVGDVLYFPNMGSKQPFSHCPVKYFLKESSKIIL